MLPSVSGRVKGLTWLGGRFMFPSSMAIASVWRRLGIAVGAFFILSSVFSVVQADLVAQLKHFFLVLAGLTVRAEVGVAQRDTVFMLLRRVRVVGAELDLSLLERLFVQGRGFPDNTAGQNVDGNVIHTREGGATFLVAGILGREPAPGGPLAGCSRHLPAPGPRVGPAPIAETDARDPPRFVVGGGAGHDEDVRLVVMLLLTG